jgi:hypothetical protein
MADEPLDRRIAREIRERLKQSRAAVLEYDRLEAALNALDRMDGASTSTGGARRARGLRTGTRAPRGANQAKALAAIQDHPGISVAELSAPTGITKNVLYGLTRTLTEQGLVERVDGGDGAIGFRIAEQDVAMEPVEAVGDGAAGPEKNEAPKRRRGSRKPVESAAESSSASEAAAEQRESPAEPV